MYITALVVDALAPSFGSEKNFGRSLQLVAYGSTPTLVAGLFQILPLLASIESVATQAEQFSQQAAAHQAYILDHTPPKLRAILLTSPQ